MKLKFIDGEREVNPATCPLSVVVDLAADCGGVDSTIHINRPVRYFDEALTIASTKGNEQNPRPDGKIIWNGEIFVAESVFALIEYRFWRVAAANAQVVSDKILEKISGLEVLICNLSRRVVMEFDELQFVAGGNVSIIRDGEKRTECSSCEERPSDGQKFCKYHLCSIASCRRYKCADNVYCNIHENYPD